MAGLTRRQLLGRSLGAASTGAALVGGGAVLPALLATTAQAESPSSAASAKTDLIVHVAPGSSGELRVMRGSEEVVVRDAQLVSRLRRASDR